MNEFAFERLGHGPNFEIALNMPLEQLRFYCVNNETFKYICMDQEFWLERLRREYPTLVSYKPIDMSWSKYYNDLITGVIEVKTVEVAVGDQLIGKVPMFSTDKFIDITQRALDLLSSKGFKCDPSSQLVFIKILKNGITMYSPIIFYTIRDMLTSHVGQNLVQERFSYMNNVSFWNDLFAIGVDCK
jgi:hypothetical protein